MSDQKINTEQEIITTLRLNKNDQNHFYGKYYVSDLIGSDCKILFILESPYKEEIIHKHPLAGVSGLNLSKLLSKIGVKLANSHSCHLPFGCWLKENIDSDVGKKFGVMEVCNFPLDIRVYSCEENKLEEVKKLDKLKNDLEKNEQQSYRNMLGIAAFVAIEQSFYLRMDKVIKNNNKMIIVGCGSFAQNFVNFYNKRRKGKNEDTVQIIKIKHPVKQFDEDECTLVKDELNKKDANILNLLQQ